MGEFDIHIAADAINRDVHDLLAKQGFLRQEFLLGDASVVRPYHFVKHPGSIQALRQSWRDLLTEISDQPEGAFQGFIESEVTPTHYRAVFGRKPFDESVRFPFKKFERLDCPIDARKAFDVHVLAAISTLDARLGALLERAGFYVVDIVKDSAIWRCYTVQPLDLKYAPVIFGGLKDYFDRAGGFEGKLKIEVAVEVARIPVTFPVPPVTRTVATVESGDPC